MLAVAESHTSGVGGHKLRLSLLRGIGPTDRGEAPRIELFGLRVQVGVHGDGVGGDSNGRVGGDDDAVGESPVDGNDTLESDCDIRVSTGIRGERKSTDSTAAD